MPHHRSRVVPHSDGACVVDAVGEGVLREWVVARPGWVSFAELQRVFFYSGAEGARPSPLPVLTDKDFTSST